MLLWFASLEEPILSNLNINSKNNYPKLLAISKKKRSTLSVDRFINHLQVL
jgi:hypothetical protein